MMEVMEELKTVLERSYWSQDYESNWVLGDPVDTGVGGIVFTLSDDRVSLHICESRYDELTKEYMTTRLTERPYSSKLPQFKFLNEFIGSLESRNSKGQLIKQMNEEKPERLVVSKQAILELIHRF